MKYSAGTVAKAFVAFGMAAVGAVAVAGGTDLASVDAGQWLGALGAGFTSAAAVFATPNKPSETAAEQVMAGIPVVVQQVHDAQANLEKVRAITTEALGNMPVFGQAARDIIDNLPRYDRRD